MEDRLNVYRARPRSGLWISALEKSRLPLAECDQVASGADDGAGYQCDCTRRDFPERSGRKFESGGSPIVACEFECSGGARERADSATNERSVIEFSHGNGFSSVCDTGGKFASDRASGESECHPGFGAG